MERDKLTPNFSFYQPVLSSERLNNLIKNNPFMPLADAVYYVIADDIVHFRVLPESKLAASRIAAELNVSRTPVKMALGLLEKDGLVRSCDGKGYIVSPFDPAEYQNFFRLRTELEAGAIRLACEKITPEQIKALKHIQKKLALAYETDNWDQIANGEQNFHQAIIKASGNNYFISAYRSLYQQIRRYRIYLFFDLENVPRINAYHRLIITALESGSADFCETMIREHLTRVPLTYSDYLNVREHFSN